MKKEGNILIVDDNRSILTSLKMLLSAYFEKVETIASPNLIKSKLQETHTDLVLLDMNFSAGINNGNEGLFWLSEIKREKPEMPVVLITAYAEIELAIQAMKNGAADFIIKPWDNAKLVSTLQTVYQSRKSCRKGIAVEVKKTNPNNSDSMYWGNSPAMQQLRFLAQKVAGTDANVLITGENGTGKEMLARSIWQFSTRKNRPLTCVDMGAITETLFESELFGHVKGAFTDARTDRAGKFEIAHQGTLFLDEIGNLPYYLQSKLLTVIQNRSVIRVGSNTPIHIDIRLICATNCRLDEKVTKGEFREDLLYRINTIHLEIPPLREHKEDILPLADLFLKRYSLRYQKKQPELSDETSELLLSHSWPGNIRELQHVIEKGVIMSENGYIRKNDLQLTPLTTTKPGNESLQTLDEMEQNMIKQALAKYKGNMSAVANQLGISRQTLYNKMKKFDI